MGEEVGTVEVRLRADIAKLEADLRRAEGKTKTAGAKMSKAFNGMTKSVLKFAGAAVGIAAVSKLMRSLVKNAGDDEAATKRLGAAMKSAGIHSDELAAKLKAQAQAYDLISAASETELTHAQAFLLNMGVTADKMDVAIDASTNLAAAMGWDLTSAVRNVGKTMGGFAGELAETIPELKAMSRETLMAGGAIDFIAAKFSGQALEDIGTFQGHIGEFGDSWEVFSAAVGKAVTKNEDLLGSIEDINAELRDPKNAEAAANFLEAMVNIGRGGLTGFEFVSGVVKDITTGGLYSAQKNRENAKPFGPELPPGWGDEDLPTTNRNKPTGGPLLTEQELKAQRTFLDKLLAEKHEANEDYHALNELRVSQEMAMLGKLKLGETEHAAAVVLIDENAKERMREKNEELFDAAEDIRVRSRDSFLNATGQEVLAVEERLARELEAYEELEAKGEDWSQQKIEAAAIAAAEIKDINEEEMEAWADLFDFMGDGFNDALASMLLDGELTFKKLGESFMREFVQLGIEKSTANLFPKLLQGALGAFGAGGEASVDQALAWAPWNESANGGPVTGFANGGPVLVGERGPELFMPGKSGFVATNQTLQSMTRRGGKDSGGVNITVVNNTGQESTTTERDGPNGDRNIEVLIGKAISKNIQKGGDVDQAIRNSYGVNRVGRHGF